MGRGGEGGGGLTQNIPLTHPPRKQAKGAGGGHGRGEVDLGAEEQPRAQTAGEVLQGRGLVSSSSNGRRSSGAGTAGGGREVLPTSERSTTARRKLDPLAAPPHARKDAMFSLPSTRGHKAPPSLDLALPPSPKDDAGELKDRGYASRFLATLPLFDRPRLAGTEPAADAAAAADVRGAAGLPGSDGALPPLRVTRSARSGAGSSAPASPPAGPVSSLLTKSWPFATPSPSSPQKASSTRRGWTVGGPRTPRLRRSAGGGEEPALGRTGSGGAVLPSMLDSVPMPGRRWFSLGSAADFTRATFGGFSASADAAPAPTAAEVAPGGASAEAPPAEEEPGAAPPPATLNEDGGVTNENADNTGPSGAAEGTEVDRPLTERRVQKVHSSPEEAASADASHPLEDSRTAVQNRSSDVGGEASSSKSLSSSFGFASFRSSWGVGKMATAATDAAGEEPAPSAAVGAPLDLVGLKNLGNTCFMNSAIQCLRHTPALKELLLRTELSAASLGREPCFSKHLAELMLNMEKMEDNASISPANIQSAVEEKVPFFADEGQHDAQEFLRMLMDQLHDDLNRIQTRPQYEEFKDIEGEPEQEKAERTWRAYRTMNDSAIVDLFCGQLQVERGGNLMQSSVRCHTCSGVFTCYDPFWDLSVPIAKKDSSGRKFGSWWTETMCTLEDCLGAFTEEEELTGDEKYLCPKCKTHQPATKWLRIHQFPKILIVHLKRFSWTGLANRSKMNTAVSLVQKDLDLANYRAPTCTMAPPMYDLYGVANHMGGLGSGHYTASCLNPGDNEWYTYNDNSVSKAKAPPQESSSAYILFYAMKEGGEKTQA